MIGFLKKTFCNHNFEFVRNVHCDEINYLDGKRSIWKCKKCETLKLQDKLHTA